MLKINVSSSQNLVPNPSFEEFVNFNTVNIKGWHKVQDSDTPDYINLGTTTSFNNIYDKYIGGVKPKDSDAYVGIFCYRINPSRHIKNIREFIETTLKTTLEKDSLYRIQVSVCLDGESNRAIKNFGIVLSNTAIQSGHDLNLSKIKPQIEFNSIYLDSTNTWITLNSLYKADGTENYVSIGNFKTDNSTQTKKIESIQDKRKQKKWNLTPLEKSSYYYVDDVSIEKIHVTQHVPKISTIENDAIKDTFNIQEIRLDSAIILQSITFDFNKWDLLPESFHELKKLYQLLKKNKTVRVKIEGHTDNVGGFEFNNQLSRKRAESVVNYLIELGIKPSRMEYAGYGYTVPISSNNSEEGRKQNRRVVFKIIEK